GTFRAVGFETFFAKGLSFDSSASSISGPLAADDFLLLDFTVVNAGSASCLSSKSKSSSSAVGGKGLGRRGPSALLLLLLRPELPVADVDASSRLLLLAFLLNLACSSS
ncbi:hypothetical protein Vafri_14026, partial [Volvox africanus]